MLFYVRLEANRVKDETNVNARIESHRRSRVNG